MMSGDAGFLRHILELPSTKIPIEDIGTVETSEVDVGAAVTVDIPEGHSGSIHEVAILEQALLFEGVHESNAGPRGGDLGKPGTGSIELTQFRPSIAVCFVPGKPLLGAATE